MKQNAVNDSQQNQGNATTPWSQTQKPWANKWVLLLIVAAVVVIIVIVVLPSLSSLSTPVITQNKSANSTTLYMSYSQAQSLLKSQLGSYNATDIFNPSSPYNVSSLVSVVPQLYGNVTSGWVTTAQAANSTTNASIDYIVITTSNAQTIAKVLGLNLTASLGIAPTTVNSGTQNGLNYTYGLYQNSTTSIQALYGFKHNNIIVSMAIANPGFQVNETDLVNTAANDA